MGKRKLLILWMGLCFLTSGSLRAQEKEFWFVAPDVSELHANSDAPTFLVISNPSDNEDAAVRVTSGNGATTEWSGTIPAKGFKKIDWNHPATRGRIENPRSMAGQVVHDKSIHITVTSGDGVLAYYQVDGSNSKDMFSLKGSYALGDTFYVSMMHDNRYPSLYSDGFDQVDIVAAQATTLTITPTVECVNTLTGTPYPAGTPFSVSLGAGDVFKLMETPAVAASATGPTLAGTQIISSTKKAIAVTVTEDGAKSHSSADVIGDQIVPITSVGTRYIVVKGYTTTPATDRLYFTSTTASGASITLTGDGGFSQSVTVGPAGSLTSTNVVNIGDSTTFPHVIYVSSTAPVYCYQVTGVGNELGSALINLAEAVNC